MIKTPENTEKDIKKPSDKTPPHAAKENKPKEIGGPEGPEPTRYGDWEIGGKCVDF